jgi:hypothetical protein
MNVNEVYHSSSAGAHVIYEFVGRFEQGDRDLGW